jgi:DNA-binding MarR family transcriptional regulator
VTDPDAVDRLVDQWRRVRPDLDGDGLDAMATIGRLGRLAAVAGPLVDRVFARHGLRTGEFDVLAALRRSGEPFVLTPSELARVMMLSAAAMTNRLDRLEAAGHVDRRLDPDNRRSILVSLTGSGRELVDAVVTEHVANELSLLAVLPPDDRRTLDALLRRLLAGLGGG